MQSMNLNGMQVIVLNHPGSQNEQLTYRNMKPRLAKQLRRLGMVHALIGVICIIFQSVSLERNLNGNTHIFSFTYVGYGYWNGLLFLVTGIIGITAGIRKSSCQVVAFNIFSIISAAIVGAMIILASLSAHFAFIERRKRCHGRGCSADPIYLELTTLTAMETLIAALGVLEGIVAIWSSIVCCLIGVCNCCLASPHQTQPVILSGEQQAALMSNPMLLPNQQKPTVGFYPQQQMAQYNKQQQNAPTYSQQSYTHNNFMSAANVERPYTGLNTGLRRSLPSPGMGASAGVITSTYEELHDYEEI